MLCYRCESTLPDGAKFCSECGAAQTTCPTPEVIPPAPSVEHKQLTVAEGLDLFWSIVTVKLNRNSIKGRKAFSEYWKREIGHMGLEEVGPRHIAALRDELLASNSKWGTQRSPANVRAYLNYLSGFYTWASGERELCKTNPVRKIAKPRAARGRVRFLEREELERLLAECKKSRNYMLYPAVLLAVSSGMRKGEMQRLEWSAVDWTRRTLTLEETKNGHRRVVPLNEAALTALKSLPQDHALVFPPLWRGSPRSEWRESFNAAVKRAGLKNFRFHDLRHTAASYLAMSGASTLEIAEVLGHRTLSMVQRYSHLSMPHLQDAVARVNEKFLGGQCAEVDMERAGR